MKKKAKKRCDCADPACELPTGRCFLCGSPSERANGTAGDRIEFTIGTCCYRKVKKLHDRDPRLDENCCRPDDDGFDDVGCPGRAPFNGDGETYAEIQRCDECGRFESDDDAAAHVAKALKIEPVYADGI